MRRGGRKRRLVASAVGLAGEVIGPIEPGCEIAGLTNGQFSLIDIIEHVLTATGPADLAVSTWTMGIYDQDRAAAFYRNGLVRRARWIVDPSMFSRRPELAGSLVQAFGVSSFRAVNTHAKFAVIVSDHLAVVVRSSMNMNPNRRIENFDISEDRAMAQWFMAIVDGFFEHRPAGSAVTQSEAVFADVLEKFEAIERDSPQPVGDVMSARVMARNLRRIFD